VATRPQPSLVTCPLTDLAAAQVRSLLASERRHWADRLGWDLRESLELTHQAISCGVLGGIAATLDGHAVGYLSCHPSANVLRLCGAHVAPDAPSTTSLALVEGVLGVKGAWDKRLEGQLTVFEAQAAMDAAFRAHGASVVERAFLGLELAAPRLRAEPRVKSPAGCELVPFQRSLVPQCARVLVAAHAGTIEASINTAFGSPALARSYLTEIVTGPGCGVVHETASSVAVSAGQVVGFCLATAISPAVGHLPQVVVDPSFQGQGIGSALMARTLAALRGESFRRVTLSVSRENSIPAAWYLRLGFAEIAGFSAYCRQR